MERRRCQWGGRGKREGEGKRQRGGGNVFRLPCTFISIEIKLHICQEKSVLLLQFINAQLFVTVHCTVYSVPYNFTVYSIILQCTETVFFKLLRRPGIDSKKSIGPFYVAWRRAGTTNLFLLGSKPPQIVLKFQHIHQTLETKQKIWERTAMFFILNVTHKRSSERSLYLIISKCIFGRDVGGKLSPVIEQDPSMESSHFTTELEILNV